MAHLQPAENRATRAQAWALHEVLVAQFIASHEVAPEEIVLDIDASDVPLHGAQEQRQFRAYYDYHCYLPPYVFCGQAMLACYLRPSQIDAAKHAPPIVKLLVRRLRRSWPDTRIIVRADSGFCRQALIRWCECAGVGYAPAAPHPPDARLAPSDARGVRRGHPAAGQRQPIDIAKCCARHVEKQWW